MLIGPSTGHKLQLITSAAADIEVSGSLVVYSNASPPVRDGGATAPFVLASIVTAATTDIVTGLTSKLTAIDELEVRNNHASTACDVTAQRTDGTNTATCHKCTLLAGEALYYLGSGNWKHVDSQGGEYTYAGPAAGNLGLSGTLAETMPRETCPEVNTAVGASGTLFLQAIYLKAGTLVSSITIASATTAAGTPTNYFFALYDASRNLLAQSANQTTGAWAANTVKTLAMSSAYRVPASGVYYIGLMMTATTVITAKGGNAKTGGQLASTAPILHGTSTTGLTTSLPNPAAAITGGTASIYAAVS